jgi:RNA polymerase sigma-70 factor (ECF subfamily)
MQRAPDRVADDRTPADRRLMAELEERYLALVHEHEARIRRICRVYAPDPDSREDLYQDILVQLWRSLPSFRGDAQPGTWLYRVALNTALGARRAYLARPRAMVDAAEVEIADARAAPDDIVDALDRLDRLYAAIAELGDIDKAVVTMYLDERSYGEIAEVLGISESNVGVKLHRIKKALAARLEGANA